MSQYASVVIPPHADLSAERMTPVAHARERCTGLALRHQSAANAYREAKELNVDSRVFETFVDLKNASLDLVVAEHAVYRLDAAYARSVREQLALSPMEPYPSGSLGSATADTSPRPDGIRGGAQLLSSAGFEDKGNHVRKKSALYANYAMYDLIESMTSEPDEIDPNTKEVDEAWRAALLDIYRYYSPETTFSSPHAWRGTLPWQVVTVDGIVGDSSGEPQRVVMCVNSEMGEGWDYGVPLTLRAEALYALDATGLPACDIIHRVRNQIGLTRVTREETIIENLTIDMVRTKANTAWSAVEHVRRDSAALPQYVKSFRQPINDYASSWAASCENVWALLHQTLTKNQVRAELQRRKSHFGSLDTAVRSLLREHFDPNKLGVMVGIDGETAAIDNGSRYRAFAPEFSDWIETGIATYCSNGSVNVELRRHGVDPRILLINGTGAVHIHNITAADVEGLPTFLSDSEWVRERLAPADVIVAHNTQFEKKCLETVLYDITSTRPWLDTLWLTRHFMPVSGGFEQNKLADFVTENGVSYIGGHHADQDALMMMLALRNFLSNWRP